MCGACTQNPKRENSKKAYRMTEPKEWPISMGLRHYMPNAMLRLTSPQHGLVTIASSLPLPSPSHGHHYHCRCWHCRCTVAAAVVTVVLLLPPFPCCCRRNCFRWYYRHRCCRCSNIEGTGGGCIGVWGLHTEPDVKK